MDIQRLNKCLEHLRKDLGEGLIASSIVAMSDCETLAETEKSSSLTASIFSEITNFIQEALSKGSYSPLGKFYYMDLAENKGLIFVTLGDYQWRIVIDTKRCKLGLLLNVTLPPIISSFEDAVINQ